MTTAFEAYCTFLAIKSHFTSPSYDYFKYNKKVRATYSAFSKRKDRYLFEKLAKIKNLEVFIAINFAMRDIGWVGDLIDEAATNTYEAHVKIVQSLTYTFKSDLKKYDDFKELFKIKKGQLPPIILQYRRGNISLETISILNSILTFTDYWSNIIDDTILWPSIKNRIEKFQPFLEFDRKKFKEIIKDMINHHK